MGADAETGGNSAGRREFLETPKADDARQVIAGNPGQPVLPTGRDDQSVESNEKSFMLADAPGPCTAFIQTEAQSALTNVHGRCRTRDPL
jgi:hypothetical protein